MSECSKASPPQQPKTPDIFKLHLEKCMEEMGWNWASKLVKAKKGDIINICGMKCEVVKTPDD